MRAKNEEATITDTNTLLSNPDVEECKTESEEKIGETGKPNAVLAPPV